MWCTLAALICQRAQLCFHGLDVWASESQGVTRADSLGQHSCTRRTCRKQTNVSPPFHCFFTGSIVPRYKICLESVHIRNGYDAQGTDLQFFACQSSFAVHVSFTRTSSTLITVCQRRLLIGKLETRFLCLPDSKVLLTE